MPKTPRQKRNPTVVIRLGSSGKLVVWSGETFNVSNGDAASLTTVASNICGLCNIA